MTDETDPEIETLQQEYPETPAALPPVAVRMDGPTTTHELPARDADGRALATTTTDVTEVASFDLRRKYLTIVGTEDLYVGHSKQLVSQGEAGQLPAGVPLSLPTSAPVFVRSITVAGYVSYWAGSWAD